MTTSWTLIGASAGTGKTHRLTDLVWDRLGAGAQPAESLVAMTFTKKAAAELGQRIRTRLFADGATDAAQRLGLAYLGTVHAIGLRLVQEHALDAGASPEVRLLADRDGRLVRGLLERAVPEGRQHDLDGLTARLRIHWDATMGRGDWHVDVFALVDSARANRIAPDALAAMAERSWREIEALLDPVDLTRDLDADMIALIDKTLDECARNGDATKGTAEALAELPALRRELKRAWDPWVRLEVLSGTKTSKLWFDALNTLAVRHLAHPRLHAELESYLREVYAAAADVLEVYQQWKAALHVVDWTDMLELALSMLDVPAVAEDLSARLRTIVVDELQDSTPLQLALFTRLHGLVGDSTWVGDPKQCIFEWTGADPALMDDLLLEIKRRHGTSEQLMTNWRSRPELVRLTSELFATAFASVGVDARDVRTSAHRGDPPELAALPPLGIAAYSKPLAAEDALAQTVAGLLASPSETPVLDRVASVVRPVEAEDIAVLVATNNECVALAEALAKLGIRAATARNGLLVTPEGHLAMAALTLLVAPDDPVAEAEIEALHGFAHHAGDDVEQRRAAWLAHRLAAIAEDDRARDEARDTPRRAHEGPWSRRLQLVRDELAALSPAAALERCFEVLDATRLTQAWPDAAQSLANLDALRGLAQRYEGEIQGGGGAVTLSGLIRTWTAARNGDSDALLDDEQHVREGRGAVTVMTYHRAKGLEWPVVILASLHKSPRRTPFEVRAESDATRFDLDDPLAGRWLRTWPWPYGNRRTGEFRRRVLASDVGLAVAAREHHECLRLLYVGFTRARDHLILSLERTAKGWITTWLNELVDLDGNAAWRLDGAPGAELTIDTPEGETLPVRTRRARAAALVPLTPRAYVHARPTTIAPRPPRTLSPSGIGPDDVTRLALARLEPGPPVQLGGSLYVGPTRAWDQLGIALHAFLASDDASRTHDERTAHADALLEGVDASLAPEDAVRAADRLRAFVLARWPECQDRARWHHEVPITATLDDGPRARHVHGVIDLLLDTHAGWVLIDHKSFPVEARLGERALTIAPQLALYRHALALADLRPLQSMWLHFPIAGAMLELIAT